MTVEAVGGPARDRGHDPRACRLARTDGRDFRRRRDKPARVNQRATEGGAVLVVNIRSLPTGQEHAVLTYEVTAASRAHRPIPKSTRSRRSGDTSRCENLPCMEPAPYRQPRPQDSAVGRHARRRRGQRLEAVEAIFDYVRGKIPVHQGQNESASRPLKMVRATTRICASRLLRSAARGIPRERSGCRTTATPSSTWSTTREGALVSVPGRRAARVRRHSEYRPIFQKGDFFRDPRDRNKTYPLLPETLEGAGGRPKVKFIRETLPN